MTFVPIIAALSGVYLAVVYALRRRRGFPTQHPYRNPYGDTPGAWRSATTARRPDEYLHRAPGTR